jgi:hypothetical protein
VPSTGIPEIVAGQIEAIEAIAPGHPVFLVTLRDGSKVVVKADGIATTSDGTDISAMTRKNVIAIDELITAVSPGASTLPLSPSEIDAVAAFALAPADLAQWVTLVRQGRNIFLKMRQAVGFTTLGKAEERNLSIDDKSKFNALIHKLRHNQKAWISMGAVSAVDLFVGNNDRIDFTLLRVGNAGNMIFQQEPNGTISKALGYDTLDPTANDSGLMYGTMNFRQWEDSFGKHLLDTRAFGRKCQAIIASFNSRSLVPLGIAPLPLSDGSSLAAGLDQGASILSHKISTKVKLGQKVPSGIMARASYLGWVR